MMLIVALVGGLLYMCRSWTRRIPIGNQNVISGHIEVPLVFALEQRLAKVVLGGRTVAELLYSSTDQPLWCHALSESKVLCVYDFDVERLALVLDTGGGGTKLGLTNGTQNLLVRSHSCEVRYPRGDELLAAVDVLRGMTSAEVEDGFLPIQALAFRFKPQREHVLRIVEAQLSGQPLWAVPGSVQDSR